MRGQPRPRQPKSQRFIYRMITEPLSEANPISGLDRFRLSFIRSLPTTKRWAMSTDFQNNVNAALEREKKES